MTLTKQLSRCAISVALICVCAWTAIPLPGIAMTMQTFGIFLSLGLLGGKWGTMAVFTYLVLGAVGLPVFSGFQGGIGILLGATGGYLWGFLAICLIDWAITARFPTAQLPSMILGLLACYACGTAWYAFGWLNGTASLPAVLVQCVLPYILPDALKLWLAHKLTRRLKRHILFTSRSS